MVTLTQSARTTLERLLARSGPAVAGLRIQATAGGCAGWTYQMGLEAEAEEGDAVIECDGVRLFIDAASQPLLDGVVVDFIESVEGAGFKFENPKATGSCGCGKSFSTSSCSPTDGPSGCGSRPN